MKKFILVSDPLGKKNIEAENGNLERIIAYAKTIATDDIIIEAYNDKNYLYCMAIDTAEKIVATEKRKKNTPKEEFVFDDLLKESN